MAGTLLERLRARRGFLTACLVAPLVLGAGASLQAQGTGRGRVAEAVFTGAVDPGSGDFLRSAIARAEREGYEALVIRMDTPGGLVSTTREIVQAELGARVPVVVYVAPSAARAGSAGVFITLAAHVAAMAPATNIGAAHPVTIGGGGPGEDEEKKDRSDNDKVLAEKIENDTAAFVEAIARERGRNVEWAISSVRESKSIPADKALELKVIDLVAGDMRELLEKIDGRQVKLAGDKEPRVLRTAGAPVDEFQWSLKQKFLHVIGEPSVASILVSLGMLGIMLEVFKPGAIVPGVVGAILLLLGVTGLSALPVSVGGAALLLIGVGLFVGELFVSSYGLLGLAGAICFAAGGILLVEPTGGDFFADADFGVSPRAILPTSIFAAATALFVGYKAVSAWRMKPTTGAAGLIGMIAEVREEIAPERAGKVWVHGELWNAVSDRSLASGARVRVVEIAGLTLRVEPEI